MAFGVDSTGFTVKTLNDLRTSLETRIIEQFGTGVDLDYDTAQGRFRDIIAGELDELWQQANNLFNARTRNGADGALLDNLAELIGTARNGPTKGTALVTLTGTADTVVPAGTQYSIGVGGAVFTQDADATLTGGTATGVAVTAQEAEAVSGAIGAIETIVTPVAGLATVTNPAAIVPGFNAETDAELRLRMTAAPQIIGINSIAAIYSRLLAIDDVVDAAVYENETGTVDAEGRPGHSIHAIVYPNTVDAATIAATVWNSRGAGIETHGTQSQTVVDSQGGSHIVKFDYATEVPVAVTLTGTKDANYPADGDAQISAALSAVITAVPLRDGVVRVFHLVGAVDEIPGLVDAAITVPAANVVLNVGEKATPGVITVTVT